MNPMPNWPNGLVYRDEHDIRTREFLITEIAARLQTAWQTLSPAVQFVRVETPCLVPTAVVQQHIDAKFELFRIDGTDLYLRPESTYGTYALFPVVFPQTGQLKKRLPLCLWQAGLSFRAEQDHPFSQLRFKEFWQLEFQLAYAPDTKEDYLKCARVAMCRLLRRLFKFRYTVSIDAVPKTELPFYSEETINLYVRIHEVMALSRRTDFDYPVVEVSCGLDQLVTLFSAE